MMLLCPVDQCLYTCTRSLELKVHINEHLLCHWYRCPFCQKCYLQQSNALSHVAICPFRTTSTPDTLREGFDARYPLLTVWSRGMGLPSLKVDRSGDAEMVVRSDPEQVWECARGSRQISYRQSGSEIALLPEDGG